MAAVIVVIGKSYKSNLPSSTISPINFGTIFARENFFQKKIHPCGSGYNTSTSACFICHIPLKNLKPSAQNPFRAEDFCSIIIEGHQKSEMKRANKKQKATESPQISYGAPETCSTPILSKFQQSNDGLKMRQKYEFMPKHLHISRIFTTFAG